MTASSTYSFRGDIFMFQTKPSFSNGHTNVRYITSYGPRRVHVVILVRRLAHEPANGAQQPVQQ